MSFANPGWETEEVTLNTITDYHPSFQTGVLLTPSFDQNYVMSKGASINHVTLGGGGEAPRFFDDNNLGGVGRRSRAIFRVFYVVSGGAAQGEGVSEMIFDDNR